MCQTLILYSQTVLTFAVHTNCLELLWVYRKEVNLDKIFKQTPTYLDSNLDVFSTLITGSSRELPLRDSILPFDYKLRLHGSPLSSLYDESSTLVKLTFTRIAPASPQILIPSRKRSLPIQNLRRERSLAPNNQHQLSTSASLGVKTTTHLQSYKLTPRHLRRRLRILVVENLKVLPTLLLTNNKPIREPHRRLMVQAISPIIPQIKHLKPASRVETPRGRGAVGCWLPHDEHLQARSRCSSDVEQAAYGAQVVELVLGGRVLRVEDAVAELGEEDRGGGVHHDDGVGVGGAVWA